MDIIEAGHKIRKKGVRPPIPEDIPESLKELLQSCWQVDPSKRPSFSDICQQIKSWRMGVVEKIKSNKSSISESIYANM